MRFSIKKNKIPHKTRISLMIIMLRENLYILNFHSETIAKAVEGKNCYIFLYQGIFSTPLFGLVKKNRKLLYRHSSHMDMCVYKVSIEWKFLVYIWFFFFVT